MATPADIRQIAAEVRENANDLRMMEVLTNWIYSDNGRMPYAGDSDVDDWNVYRNNIPTREMVIEEYEQRYGVVAGTEFDHIPPLIESYGTDLTAYEAVLENLAAATKVAGGDGIHLAAQTEVDLINLVQVDWAGAFADELKTQVLAPMPAVGARQQNVLAELQAAVMSHKELAARTNGAIYEIGVKTRDALKDAIHARVRTSDTAVGWEIVGYILSIGLTTGALVLAPPHGATMAVALVSAAQSAATGAIALNKATNTVIVGDQVDAIMGAMHEAITLLAQDIDSSEKGLCDFLEQDLVDLEGLAGSASKRAEFEGIRPHLADERPSGGDFRHEP